MTDKGEIALQLWHQWFEEDGDPRAWYQEIDLFCFFCGEDWHTPMKHRADCVFVKAKALVEKNE